MTHVRRYVSGLVIIYAWLGFRADPLALCLELSLARETTNASVGVVPICSVFGPPFYITRCPFTSPRDERSSSLLHPPSFDGPSISRGVRYRRKIAVFVRLYTHEAYIVFSNIAYSHAGYKKIIISTKEEN